MIDDIRLVNIVRQCITKTQWKAHRWLLFGIYECGIIPKDMRTENMKQIEVCIVVIYYNGKEEYDKESVSFLYSLNENKIDMFVYLIKEEYHIQLQMMKGNKEKIDKKFDTNIFYIVYWNYTQVQIASLLIGLEKMNTNHQYAKY